MKKKYIPLVLALSCMLAACGGENGASSNVQNSTPVSSNVATEKHTVTYAESADYTVTGLVEGGYAEGETVSFKIQVNNAAKEVDDVVVNRQALTPAADGTYSFTMGDSNVTINITLKDKANAKTAGISVSKENPEVGDTITVNLTLDNVAVTSGVTITATAGADKVEITGNSVKCVAAGSATLEAKATVDGIQYSKTRDITIAEGLQLVTIKSIGDTMPTFDNSGNATWEKRVAVEGRVINMNYNGPVVYDGTGVIQVYDKSFATDYPALANLAVGDYVRVTGAPTRYKKADNDIRWWQFTCFDSSAKKLVVDVAKIQHAEIAVPAVEDADFTYDEMKAYATPAATAVKVVTFTAKAHIDGTHVNLQMKKTDGSYDTTNTISYYNNGTDLIEGVTYTMSAVLGEKQQGKYLVAYILNDTIVRNYETATGVTISGPTTLLLANTAGIQLTAVVSPELANQEVVWSSENPDIAAVSATGLVTPVSAGNATIKATQKGGTVFGTYTVRVLTEAIAATSIELDKTEESVAVGGTVTLTPTVAPANSTDLVEWSTSDATVATVEDGVVTGVKAGNATITAKAGDKTATCAITVTDPYGTVESPISVSELIALANEVIPTQSTYSDKKVVVTGKMANNATIISGKTNYQFTIADMDDPTKTFPVYACDIDAQIGVPTVGNFVVVTGYLNNYKGTKQISYKGSENSTLLSRENGTAKLTVNAEHATVTGVPATAENGTEVSFTVVVDDEYVLDSVKLGTTELTAVEGTYSFTVAGDATITVATHKEGEAASVTITKTMEAMATALSWKDSQQYASWNLDANVVVSTTASGNNGKYYTSNKSWRIYDKPVVITAGEGYKLVSVTFTYTRGAVTGAANGAVVTVDATSFSGAVSARTDITAISVTYIAA